MSLLDLAPDLLAIPTTPAAGTAEAIEFLCSRVLSHLPVSIELMRAAEGDGREANLLATLGGSVPEKQGLLLLTHLDTVPPGDPAAWTETGEHPLAPRAVGDRLFGLGAADAKLDFLCKAEALARLSRGCSLRRPVHLLATYGEETGMRGMRDFLARRPLSSPPTAALVGEPSDLKLAVRHKGRLELQVVLRAKGPPRAARSERLVRLRVHGRAAHASRPSKGKNAIETALGSLRPDLGVAAVRGGVAPNTIPALCELVAAADSVRGLPATCEVAGAPQAGEAAPMPASLVGALRALPDVLARAARAFPQQDPLFDPPQLTHALCLIEARGALAEAKVDIRLLPGQEAASVARTFAERCRALAGEAVSVDCSVVHSTPPLEGKESEPLVVAALSALAACDLPPETVTKAGCTEAGLLAAAGIPAVVFGPGPPDAIHRPNEWTSLAALRRAVDFYERFITEWCAA